MQTWANNRGKQISVSGQAEMKIHFMNIGFHYEEQLCCGSFLNVHVHESFNMGCLFEMSEKSTKKMGEPFPDRASKCPDHVYAFRLVTQEKKQSKWNFMKPVALLVFSSLLKKDMAFKLHLVKKLICGRCVQIFLFSSQEYESIFLF